MKKTRILLVLCAAVALGGCTTLAKWGYVQRSAVSAATPLLGELTDAAYMQDDLKLIEQAAPANLAIISALIEVNPDNRDLLALAAQFYQGFAFGIVEDQDPEWAKKLYMTAVDYGIRSLKRNRKFRKEVEKGTRIKDAVKHLKKKDLQALFWTASSWGAWVNVNYADPRAMIKIPTINAMMDRVIELDPEYFYRSAYLYFGAFHANYPSIMGPGRGAALGEPGGVEAAKKNFDKVFEKYGEKFLMAHVLYAQYYATLLQDEDLFRKELRKVLVADSNALREQALANEAAKRKAKILLSKIDKLF